MDSSKSMALDFSLAKILYKDGDTLTGFVRLMNRSESTIEVVLNNPQQVIGFTIADAKGKETSCVPPERIVAYSGGSIEVKPHTDYSYPVSLKDWGCPSLKEGSYTIKAFWELKNYSSTPKKKIGRVTAPSIPVVVSGRQ